MTRNENPYTVRIEETDGIKRYYISFTDGGGERQETEVGQSVYEEMEKCRKHEKRQLNFFDRYIEHSELTEKSLLERSARPFMSLEESVVMNDRKNMFRSAISELPEIQRRRFLLYFVDGFTYEQIADREGCSHVAVINSVNKAKTAIQKKNKNF